jgi:hypothetical protein
VQFLPAENMDDAMTLLQFAICPHCGTSVWSGGATHVCQTAPATIDFYPGMHVPPLTPAQALDIRIRSDRANIDHIGPYTANGMLCQLVTDCAVRLLAAKKCDSLAGGCEFERKALENLQMAVRAYAERCPQ